MSKTDNIDLVHCCNNYCCSKRAAAIHREAYTARIHLKVVISVQNLNAQSSWQRPRTFSCEFAKSGMACGLLVEVGRANSGLTCVQYYIKKRHIYRTLYHLTRYQEALQKDVFLSRTYHM